MVKRAPPRRRPRKAKPGTKGLGPAECRLQQPTGAAAEAAEAIPKAGGCVVGSYKEPLAGHPVLLDLEERVAAAVKKLKERGLVSPYLRSFVVARINPLRWIKGEPPPLEEVLKTMRERAGKFNVEKIRSQDLAGAAGPPDEEA